MKTKHDLTPAQKKTKIHREQKRAEREAKRISSDHNLLGELETAHHRDKDISLAWSRDPKTGTFHATACAIKIGGGIDCSDEDWAEIWRDKTDAGE